MDFLENVKRALSDTAQTVTKASEEAVDKVKTKYSIYDMNGDIKRLLGEIGLEVYKSYKDGAAELNDASLEKCREIDRKNEQIEAAEMKLNCGKSFKVCGACGERAPKSAVYCSKCGEKFDGDDIDSDGGVTITITED